MQHASEQARGEVDCSLIAHDQDVDTSVDLQIVYRLTHAIERILKPLTNHSLCESMDCVVSLQSIAEDLQSTAVQIMMPVEVPFTPNTLLICEQSLEVVVDVILKIQEQGLTEIAQDSFHRDYVHHSSLFPFILSKYYCQLLPCQSVRWR
jgi:hypothetical protein